MSHIGFNELFKQEVEQLDLFTKAITRAHGENHPEAYLVRKLFEKINEKVAASKGEQVELREQFMKLREVTQDYEIPTDVCETYATVYSTLQQLDKAYNH